MLLPHTLHLLEALSEASRLRPCASCGGVHDRGQRSCETLHSPATGQTRCWGIENTPPTQSVFPIDCAGTGQDGDIQAGADLSYTDTGLTIIDNNTKLEWMKQDDNDSLGSSFLIVCDPASYPDNLDVDCGFTWDDAFAFVATLNAYNHAGYADWRVPNVKELHSIVNYSFGESGDETGDPSISAAFNTECEVWRPMEYSCTMDECSCTSLTSYWSSTSLILGPDAAWLVRFDAGTVGPGDKGGTARIRAVRGGL